MGNLREAGFNIAFMTAVLAGLDEAPGVTVNRYCSSSLQTIRTAHAIKAGEGDCFIAAGVETVSRYAAGAGDTQAPCSRQPASALHHEPVAARHVEPTSRPLICTSP